MKSTAHFKDHPIHPMLVPFPIAFFTGTFLFDVLALIFGEEKYFQTASHLNIAGIVAALIAAIPGSIDYFFSVPPKSTGKKRAAKHGLINLSVVIIFLIIYIYRHTDRVMMLPVVSLDLFGVVCLTIAGWMGGTLVNRNMMGVNHRYAGAGKWKELYVKDPGNRIEAAHADELKTDQMKLIHAGEKRIVLGRTETGYVAFEDHCTHRGGSLAGGVMVCGTVQCLWHGSQFDVYSGAVNAGPAKEPVKTFRVTEEGGKIFIDLNTNIFTE